MEEGNDHGNVSEQPLTEATIAPQPPTGLAQPHNANEPSIRIVLITFEDRIVDRILNGLKLQGCASSHHDGELHDNADDEQHDEPSANATIDASIEGERDLHLVEAKGDHVLEANAVVAAGGDKHLALVQAERDHVPQSTLEGNTSRLSSLELSDVHRPQALISDPIE
ncbi:Uncharacterized protein TCM_032890 [Theobroma cacao]|uniref:Uncharacterized protein n=1 Tax=Theobroma cacao TaxID=3641 RepID=A0A061FA99_THECC|nr:Uncharacterized protein TCM_032890 [Theobroma cacao]